MLIPWKSKSSRWDQILRDTRRSKRSSRECTKPVLHQLIPGPCDRGCSRWDQILRDTRRSKRSSRECTKPVLHQLIPGPSDRCSRRDAILRYILARRMHETNQKSGPVLQRLFPPRNRRRTPVNLTSRIRDQRKDHVQATIESFHSCQPRPQKPEPNPARVHGFWLNFCRQINTRPAPAVLSRPSPAIRDPLASIPHGSKILASSPSVVATAASWQPGVRDGWHVGRCCPSPNSEA